MGQFYANKNHAHTRDISRIQKLSGEYVIKIRCRRTPLSHAHTRDISRIQKISDEYVIKIRCLEAPLSHFKQTGQPMQLKIIGECTIKKRWLRVSDSCFKNYLIQKWPPQDIFWSHPGLRWNKMSVLEMTKKIVKNFSGKHIIKINTKTVREKHCQE